MTDKQKKFVAAYVGEAGFNATQAAEIAGYSNPKQQGYELKNTPAIREEIDAILDAETLSAKEVLRRLSDQATGNIKDFIEITGNSWFFDLEKAEEAKKLHLIKSLAYGKGGMKIEMYDAQAALVQIGRHHKLFVDKTESEVHTSGYTDEELIAEATRLVGGVGTPQGADEVSE